MERFSIVDIIMKNIEGYEKYYAITKDGKVYSHKSKRFLKPCDNGDGYLQLSLYRDSKPKTFKVHKLVARAFVPNPDNLKIVNHKNFNRKDNRADNLEWCTQEHNINHSKKARRMSSKTKGKLNRHDADFIKTSERSIKNLAKMFNVEVRHIRRIKSGESWS